jgi:hypothetical protein
MELLSSIADAPDQSTAVVAAIDPELSLSVSLLLLLPPASTDGTPQLHC